MSRKYLGLLVYFVFLLLPIYWLVIMSLKTNEEILGGLTLFPARAHARQLCARSSPIRPGTTATSTR